MKIYLVRHGESLANIDKAVHFTTPDHAIELSELGHRQATAAGEKLAAALDHSAFACGPDDRKLRIWCSPYQRTRQTADHICSTLRAHYEKLDFRARPLVDRREHVLLCEQQFGLFDGLEDEQLAQKFPEEHAHYALHEKFEGRFWARMPLGESRFDVACRVHQAFGTFHRDAERHGINTIIVVCHGLVLRAFTMMWLHYTPEWFDREPNPKNCAIRVIEDGEDRGYL